MLDDYVLKAVSAHVNYLTLRDDFKSVDKYHKALGTQFLTIPYLREELRSNENDLHNVIKTFPEIGKRCNDAGYRFLYHNHDFEFETKIENKITHDYIFETMSNELINSELDTYFIWKVGRDPASYIKKFKNRVIMSPGF